MQTVVLDALIPREDFEIVSDIWYLGILIDHASETLELDFDKWILSKNEKNGYKK